MGMMDMVRDWFAPVHGRNVMPPDIRADFMRGNRGVVFGGWRPALREAADDVGASWDLAAARTIDLIQNSGWMAGALDQAVEYGRQWPSIEGDARERALRHEQ